MARKRSKLCLLGHPDFRPNLIVSIGNSSLRNSSLVRSQIREAEQNSYVGFRTLQVESAMRTVLLIPAVVSSVGHFRPNPQSHKLNDELDTPSKGNGGCLTFHTPADFLAFVGIIPTPSLYIRKHKPGSVFSAFSITTSITSPGFEPLFLLAPFTDGTSELPPHESTFSFIVSFEIKDGCYSPTCRSFLGRKRLCRRTTEHVGYL
jgi:hypothetical protein